MLKKGITTLMVLLMVFQIFLPFEISAQESSDLYGIQMGVFNEISSAQSMLSRLEENNVDGYIISVATHRVFYGIFGTWDEAEKQLVQARKIVESAYIVKLNDAQIKVYKEKYFDQTDCSTCDKEAQEVEIVKVEDVTEDIPDVVNQGADIKVYNHIVSNDVRFMGFHGVYSTSVEVHDKWNLLEGGYFKIRFSHSVPNTYFGSSITILVNGKPVYSKLFDADSVYIQEINVPLSPAYFNDGLNEIQIKTYHRLSDDPCEFDTNPALWVTLHNKSYIHLEYTETQESCFINDYPYPYIKEYRDDPVNFSYVIDDNVVDENILKAVYTMSANMGQRVREKTLDFNIIGLELESLEEDNYIFIGREVPLQLRHFFEKDFILEKGYIYICERYLSQDSGNKILFILSEDTSSLPPACDLFSDDALVSQMKNGMVIKADEVPVSDAVYFEKEYISFKELGYGNIFLEGGRQSSAGYFVDFPDNWKIEEGAKIILKLRYSEALKHASSACTVFINNIPLGSVLLDKESSSGKIAEFNIPYELMNDYAFDISVSFYLDGDIDCKSGSDYKNLWAFVSEESMIYLPYTSRTYYDFEDYPAPFVSDGKLDKFSFFFNEDARLSEFSCGAGILGFMGRNINSVGDFDVVIFNDEKDLDMLNDGNNIIFSKKDSRLIRHMNSMLPVPYDSAFENFLWTDGFLIDIYEKSSYSTAQLVRNNDSPFINLVLTGNDNESLLRIGNFFYDVEKNRELKGNSVFVNERDLIQTASIGNIKVNDVEILNDEKPSQAAIPARPSENQLKNYLIYAGVIILFLIIFLIYYKRRQTLK